MAGSSGNIAVVGGGLVGRLAALKLRMQGFTTTLFDKYGPDGGGSCSAVAAGLLTPDIEAALGEPKVARLGRTSLQLWQHAIDLVASSSTWSSQNKTYLYSLTGSFVCAREQDLAELLDFRRNLLRNNPTSMPDLKLLHRDFLALQEPFFSETSLQGYMLPGNGFVNPVKFMMGLLDLLEHYGANLKWHTNIDCVEPFSIRTADETQTFDMVIDARGMGAREDISTLRGVRGELILIESKELKIQHAMKILHPRFPVYIVPRGGDRYIVGATCIESQSSGEPTVQSVMDLLAGVADVHHGFRQANIISMHSQLRPAMPDNLPILTSEPGLLRINGLYRHGILLAPLLAECAYSAVVGDGLTWESTSEDSR